MLITPTIRGLITVMACTICLFSVQAEPLYLARGGTTETTICYSPAAPEPVRYAAEELQAHLLEITGATFAIVPGSDRLAQPCIWLGTNPVLPDPVIATDSAILHDESYWIITAGDQLIIDSPSPRGILYGVYGLLEDHFGCRWYTPDIRRIPKRPDLLLPILFEIKSPILEYREAFVYEAFDGDWACRNRMNGNHARFEPKHGGHIQYEGFVHTFEELLSPEEFFEEHPEYFSMIDGERRSDRPQLCCTNAEVAAIITERIRMKMREHPEATVFSVSQNDWIRYCECGPCTALADKEGSQMAPILLLVNRVADAVYDEFPDKLLSTLAYQYSRKPPKTMPIAKNVIIRLCSIECCFAHPFAECDDEENIAFVDDVLAWEQKGARIWVWDYTTDFDHYLLPYPNLRVRGPNIRFLIAHGVRGIFEQDVSDTPHAEFATLSAFLGAKLLWDPNADVPRLIDEFLNAVYSDAADPIQDYLDLLHNKVAEENIHIFIRDTPEAAYLTDALLAEADMIWDRAEAEVSDQPEVLARVQAARLSVDYAVIERQRARGLTVFKSASGTQAELYPDFKERLDRFIRISRDSGVKAYWEGTGKAENYLAELEALLAMESPQLLPAVAVADAKPGLAYHYYEGSWYMVPDFDALSPVASGVVEEVSIAEAQRLELFGFQFYGFVKVPEDGMYQFSISSNDGSKLWIGDRLLIDNDGLHAAKPRYALIALKAGFHPLRISYFESAGSEYVGITYTGPGIPQQPVPLEALWHQ